MSNEDLYAKAVELRRIAAELEEAAIKDMSDQEILALHIKHKNSFGLTRQLRKLYNMNIKDAFVEAKRLIALR